MHVLYNTHYNTQYYGMSLNTAMYAFAAFLSKLVSELCTVAIYLLLSPDQKTSDGVLD